jgi:predicted nucleic acid-binding protein
MPINQQTILFFDSSCLVAAAGSPTGGSSLLLAICGARGFLTGAVSHAVLAEAEGNVLSNLRPQALIRYRQEILSIPLIIAPVPTPAEQEAVVGITEEKDAHVLAAALSVSAQFLITLDKPLSSRIAKNQPLIHALSPGEFIRRELPTHPAYPSLRSG